MTPDPSIADIRKVYKLHSLSETDVHPNPLEQFHRWWQQAIQAQIDEVNAMALSTCSTDGHPSSRIVLLKGMDENGFVFFTNYESRKGREMESNPRVSALFFWKEMERQVRIEGTIEKISEQESDSYFLSRPRESRIGAWSSPQSRVIESREALNELEHMYEEKFRNQEVPRPSHWGGYRILPVRMEFWQGRPGRLHDRIQYLHRGNNNWEISRLAP